MRPEIRASTAIVGAGPAGLLAAIAHGAGALLLERNPDAGRKLLVSGAGQCNFSNNLSREDFLRACGRAANFLKPAIYQFGNEDFISLLAEAGCPTLIREDGKAFPASLRAADLRDALVRQVLYGISTIFSNRITIFSNRQFCGFAISRFFQMCITTFANHLITSKIEGNPCILTRNRNCAEVLFSTLSVGLCSCFPHPRFRFYA